jgi:hypothetical protein
MMDDEDSRLWGGAPIDVIGKRVTQFSTAQVAFCIVELDIELPSRVWSPVQLQGNVPDLSIHLVVVIIAGLVSVVKLGLWHKVVIGKDGCVHQHKVEDSQRNQTCQSKLQG